MMRKITLIVKFDKKYVHHFLIQLFIFKCECGAMEEYQVGVPEGNGSILFSFLQAGRVKCKITLVRFFWEALRHICVTAGA